MRTVPGGSQRQSDKAAEEGMPPAPFANEFRAANVAKGLYLLRVALGGATEERPMSAIHAADDLILTRDEIVERIEREARARRGVSAAALIGSYRDGTLDEPCEVMDILGIAFLLPSDDPLHAPLDK